MCGISGIVYLDKNSTVDRSLLQKMNTALIHRGPDDEGYFLRGNVGLAIRRLSIIDVKGGKQPIFNEDKTVCVVCNGEIYNYMELRDSLEKKGHYFSTHSDVEVIVHLYEESGENFVRELRGMFACAVFDLQRDKLILARDRLGIKPLFYSEQNGAFVFASELKALLQFPGIKKEVSCEDLSDYLTYFYTFAPHTIFKHIFKLPPAHILVLNKNTTTISQYWEISYHKNREIDERFYEERLEELLKESVKMHLMSEVPLGAFLSGGMDSSAIVALMAEVAGKKIKTFSVGFDVSDFNELKYAKLVAKKFDTEHYEINLSCDIVNILPKIVAQFDEPFADSSAIPTYLISQFAKQNVAVCLAGDGGDELFAGYGWTRRQKFINDYNRLPSLLRSGLKTALLHKNYSPDYKAHSLDKMSRFVYDSELPLEQSFMRRKTCFSETMKRELLKPNIYSQILGYESIYKLRPYLQSGVANDELEKLLNFDTKSYLPDDGLCKVDRMSMMNSLEVRVPFLDHKVVEFVAAMPFKYKMRGKSSKYILKKIMKNRLPKETLAQRKLGFAIPLNSWFRMRLQNYAKELLVPDCRLSQIINMKYVHWMLKEHFESRQDFGSQIYVLVVLELWLKSQGAQLSW